MKRTTCQKPGFLAAIIVLLLSLPARSGDWTQFRGSDGSGSSDETGLPAKWSQTENLRWKAGLPGRGLSSPVIAGGRVYVTASSGFQESRLHVLSFDLATGKKVWERQFYSTGGTVCHPKTSMAAPTPVTDGEHVWALFATCDAACLDKDGNLVWYRSLVRDYPTVTNQVGMASSPVLWKDTFIVQLENAGESFVAGIDTRTGRNRWKFERPRQINWNTPLLLRVGDRAQLILQASDGLFAHDPATGQKLWAFGGGFSTIPSPAGGDGMVLAPGGDLIALKPPVGKGEPVVLWKSNRLRPNSGSPLYYRGRAYAVNSAGILCCADGTTGKLLWQERVQGPFWSSPIAADGKIYLASEKGVVSVVQAGDKPKVLATNDMKEDLLCTPAVADGALFLRSDRDLYCIAEKK